MGSVYNCLGGEKKYPHSKPFLKKKIYSVEHLIFFHATLSSNNIRRVFSCAFISFGQLRE